MPKERVLKEERDGRVIKVSLPEKVLILLQENSGRVPLPDAVGEPLRSQIFNLIDTLVETVEDLKTRLQGAGKYDIVQLLTDASCKRQQLLDALVEHSRHGRIIDLVILGHGSPEMIALNGETLGSADVRRLLADAQARGCSRVRLRMVYSCSCYGSTLNDDWLSIGASVAIASDKLDWMPEPMTTYFLHRWLGGESARGAADNAYQDTIPVYAPIFPPTIQPRFRTVTYEYPCGVEGWPPRVKMCVGTQQVPDGFDTIANSNVVETRLVTSGDGEIKF